MRATYSVVAYNKAEMLVEESDQLQTILPLVTPERVSWVTLSGINLVDDHLAVKATLEHFHLNSRLFESIFKPERGQLEEEHDGSLYLDYSILLYRPTRRAYTRVRGSLILGPRFLILLEKTPSGLFERTRGKIGNKHTKAQNHGADYLLYLLIKTIIINYQHILKSLAEKFEVLEDEVISHPGQEAVYDKILEMREEVKPLYTHLTELADLIREVEEAESPLIGKEVRRSMARLNDHEIKEMLADYQHLRAWVTELIDIHRAGVNESANRVMKTLTIISTIFLPLTFIAGVYGMNFDIMPELRWEHGYPLVMGFMLLLAVGALALMRIRKWI